MRDWKRWVPLAVVLLLGFFALRGRLDQLQELGQTLRGGRVEWIALALVLQILAIFNQPALYQSLYEMLGLRIRWRDMAPLVWAGHFVNVATPSAGLGGTALLLADGKKRGFSASRVALANTLYFGLNFAWFAILLGFGLWALAAKGDLSRGEVGASTSLFVTLLVILVALGAAAIWPGALEKPILALARGVNTLARPFVKRELWPRDKARAASDEVREAMVTFKGAKSRLGRPLFHTFWVDAFGIGVLGACWQAFPGQGHLSFALLVAAYSIATLFLVFSVTPQGLGVVEGVLVATLMSLGSDLNRATLVVIAYRGLSFWLPLLFGFLASKSALSLGTNSSMNSFNRTSPDETIS